MELLAELLANLVLALGIFLVQWCIRHKNITLLIIAVAMVVADIFMLLKVLR